VATTRTHRDEPAVLDRLSPLDRFLPAWIITAMALGLGLGRVVPGLDDGLDAIKVGSVSLPIAVGLVLMMYPVLAKVRYSQLGTVTTDRRMVGASLALNWLIGPALMFVLAWALLPDLPEYRTGLIVVGLARCIAMVLIWNDLAGGNREAAVFLVAVNSVFQIAAYSLLGWFYLDLLPGWLGWGDGEALGVGLWDITRAVLLFLGVPLAAGSLSRLLGEARRGREWYEERFLPRIGPVALYGLLFTIVVLFALQGDAITSAPGDVARIAIPLLAYFALMWGGAFALGLRLGLPYDRNITVAFTAAGNNFELAIAVAISVFGVTSGQALAGVVGPLIEVPVLVALVYVALWAGRSFYPDPAKAEGRSTDGRPTVLFLCVHNAGRSQMALGWFTHLAGDRAVAWSGGSEPATQINPVAIAAMAEVGIDISGEHPTPWTDEIVGAADVVITMGCGDACPLFPGKRCEDWDLDDPAGQDLEHVRPIRDDIRACVEALLASLDVPATT